MDVIVTWTGRHAAALRQALRMTNERFAERLGTAVRTVAKWNATPSMVLTPEMQTALDTFLAQAPQAAKERFHLLLGSSETRDTGEDTSMLEVKLSTDLHLGAALEWLDRISGWPPGESRRRVLQRASEIDTRHIQDRSHHRRRIGHQELATALERYYHPEVGPYNLYRASCAGQSITTTLLVQASWLDLALPLGTRQEHIRFVPSWRLTSAMDDIDTTAAVERLAEVLTTSTRLVNAPIYQLLSVDLDSGQIEVTVGLIDFLTYAFTVDLLENETLDAIAAARTGNPLLLPLRDRYLPDIDSVLSPRSRVCAGGPLALTAIARPRTRSNNADYLLLVQERSGSVLNAARRLAVIPKSFHGPLVDYNEDADIFRTLEREMEEELFGREDVDSVLHNQRGADPMHPSRLSEPMRWLHDHSGSNHWRMECTGFGFNLVSGNYEFANLIVIHDEEWWTRYGGRIEANWESAGLRRYSTRDSDAITALIHEPSWSNEGLFALLQGLRRLADIGGDRVDLPTIQLENYQRG